MIGCFKTVNLVWVNKNAVIGYAWRLVYQRANCHEEHMHVPPTLSYHLFQAQTFPLLHHYHVFSLLTITFFTAIFPSSISPLQPTVVVSSTTKHRSAPLSYILLVFLLNLSTCEQSTGPPFPSNSHIIGPVTPHSSACPKLIRDTFSVEPF